MRRTDVLVARVARALSAFRIAAVETSHATIHAHDRLGRALDTDLRVRREAAVGVFRAALPGATR